MILAGDIGGTKTNIALFESDAASFAGGSRRPKLLCEHAFASKEHQGLAEIIERFFELNPNCSLTQVKAASFGIAGPIVERHVQIPNLAYDIDGAALEQRFGLPRLFMLNDLEATAEGVMALEGSELEVLNAGKVATDELKTGAVIAAGTGLGMAVLHPVQGEWLPLASEGGHADFAPRTELEMALLRFLLQRHKRVSVERVVSGPGVLAIYAFLLSAEGKAFSPAPNPTLKLAIEAAGPAGPALITKAALTASCPVCELVLEVFVGAYGAAAGNLALTAIASGGLYVGGGIAPKILAGLKSHGFMRAFQNKGRLSPLLETMPVCVILNPKTALLGAARHALRALRA